MVVILAYTALQLKEDVLIVLSSRTYNYIIIKQAGMFTNDLLFSKENLH